MIKPGRKILRKPFETSNNKKRAAEVIKKTKLFKRL